VEHETRAVIFIIANICLTDCENRSKSVKIGHLTHLASQKRGWDRGDRSDFRPIGQRARGGAKPRRGGKSRPEESVISSPLVLWICRFDRCGWRVSWGRAPWLVGLGMRSCNARAGLYLRRPENSGKFLVTIMLGMSIAIQRGGENGSGSAPRRIRIVSAPNMAGRESYG
jgi:hypothetical protein